MAFYPGRMILNPDDEISTLRWTYALSPEFTTAYDGRFDVDGNGTSEAARFVFTLAGR